ncbi:putative oxalate decarboxylase/oxidase [Melanogaster broomeanus]|nr:putative oxalate decarboxylase/oxidase [Melanogaster broomeanus]
MWSLLSFLAIASSVVAVPAPSASSAAPAATPTVPYASEDPNYPLWTEGSVGVTPEPIRGQLGATILGPQNIPMELQNSDTLAPPTTDNGAVASFKWPFSLSHNRLQSGGWAREQSIKQMPVATDLAGVNMRLEVGAIREMHWHTDGEWAYVLSGDLRVSCLTPDGQVYLNDVIFGTFPPGYPHSIQAKNTTADGAEFLLIFDSGAFSEDSTFLLTLSMYRTGWPMFPKKCLPRTSKSTCPRFDHIPSEELYIFPGNPPPDDVYTDMVVPNDTPVAYTFAMSQVASTPAPGGSYKIVDSRTFPAATTICGAEVTVEVGGMRELHWHPTEPEWTYFVAGSARITVYASSSNAQTFDFQAGDIAYIPPSYGHYIENTGNSTLRFLEIFRSALFQDFSLNQWLALTPPELVKAHLNLDDATIARLSKVKQPVVGPAQPVA